MKPVSSQFINRINALDLIRGWCLIVIAADHISLTPSLFDLVTGRGLLWVTAAEGFFFISGMLVGIARGKQAAQTNLWTATKKLWARATSLYFASVILTLIYTGLSIWLESLGVTNLKAGLVIYGSIWELLQNTLTLRYNYGWADFLSYYAVFLAIAPLALWLLRRGLWWVVLCISTALWLLKDVIPLPFPHWYGLWQSYFFFGVVCGYHLADLARYAELLSSSLKRNLRIGLLITAAVSVVASFIFTFATPFIAGHHAISEFVVRAFYLPPVQSCYNFFFSVKENETFKALFQNYRGGLLRLPIFFIWIGALFIIVWRYEDWIIKRLGWLLLPLGRNSLYVYIMESLVIFGLLLLPIPKNFFINSLVVVIVIALTWIMVRFRVLFSVIPR